MVRPSIWAAVCALLLCSAATYSATTYTFAPSDKDLCDLDHNYYYSWGVKLSLPANETIQDVTLSIKNIYNWQVESGNVLYIHLLDNPAVGIKDWYDNEGGGDAWKDKGVVIDSYHDPDAKAKNLSYSLKSLGLLDQFKAYAADGVVGLGLDPDCHYYNDGFKLSVVTVPSAVPEPGSILALATGMISLSALPGRRRKRQNK